MLLLLLLSCTHNEWRSMLHLNKTPNCSVSICQKFPFLLQIGVNIPITLLIGMRLLERKKKRKLRHPVFLHPTKTDFIILFLQLKSCRLFSNRVDFSGFSLNLYYHCKIKMKFRITFLYKFQQDGLVL